MFTNNWVTEQPRYEALAHAIDTAIRIYSKNNWLFRLLSRLPWLGDEFMRNTASIYGPMHFYPEGWTDITKELHHEGRHTTHQRWLGLGIHPWVGFLPYAILCALVLPIGLKASFWFELDAEAAALEFKYRTGSNTAYIKYALVEFACLLSSAAYGYAWPRSLAISAAKQRADKIVKDGQGKSCV